MLHALGRCALRGGVLFALCASTTTLTAQTINKYDVNFTENPPTIDGIVSPGEWDDAVAAEGGWHLLRDTSRVDNQNSRWQAVWDDDALYILFQSDYKNWSPSPSSGSLDWNADNINFYIDPNVDGEENIVGDGDTDGYQIAFNQLMGDSGIENTAGINTGLFLEAHEDSPFGNQGQWLGLLDTYMRQKMTNNGGVTEVKFTWLDFDADNPEPPENNPEVNGLYHPFAPQPDDTWFFKIARITSDPNNYLPDWNPTDSQSFAVRPHGEITFVKGGVSVPGDTNGDGKVDLVDLNNVRNNFGGTTGGDTNGDGAVDLVDLNNVRNNFGAAAGANAVPEPSSLALIALGTLAFAFIRKK
jgi:hypothetical protein